MCRVEQGWKFWPCYADIDGASARVCLAGWWESPTIAPMLRSHRWLSWCCIKVSKGATAGLAMLTLLAPLLAERLLGVLVSACGAERVLGVTVSMCGAE